MTTSSRPQHPVVTRFNAERYADLQLRVADTITAFAGSMPFVYLHAVVFAVWMLFIERSPWPTLTLVVSLEAIFLSTFVMIGQNRQAAFQQAKADHDFVEQELELKTNTDLTRQIHALTVADPREDRRASAADVLRRQRRNVSGGMPSADNRAAPGDYDEATMQSAAADSLEAGRDARQTPRLDGGAGGFRRGRQRRGPRTGGPRADGRGRLVGRQAR